MPWDKLLKKTKNPAPEIEEIDILLAQTFSTPQGHKVLMWLRQITKERVVLPDVSESALRALEGKRHLVHVIETRIARARKQDVGSYREQFTKSSTSE